MGYLPPGEWNEQAYLNMQTLTACPIASSSLVARTSLGLQHRFPSSLPGDGALHAPTEKIRRRFAPFKMAHFAPFETLGIYGRVCKHAGPPGFAVSHSCTKRHRHVCLMSLVGQNCDAQGSATDLIHLVLALRLASLRNAGIACDAAAC